MRAALTILVACALAAAGAQRLHAAAGPGAGLTAEQRVATLRFAPAVAERDRAWILAAVARARPEAQRLIAEVDGLVEVQTDLPGGQAIGLAEMRGDAVTISLDPAALNGERALDRDVVVLHELGHVVDFVLVDDALVQRLDAAIPRLGTDDPAERFAETFAKWALRGRVSIAGDGYGIPNPASLEDWGAPLGRLAIELDLET